jgi:hypothetical protein
MIGIFKTKKLTRNCEFCERERIRTFDRLLRRQMLYPAELRTHYIVLRKLLKQSGRQDSNLRPPGPKPGAMTGLRYAPRIINAESKGFEPLVPFPVRMFSKHVLSASQATLHLLLYFKDLCSVIASANIE